MKMSQSEKIRRMKLQGKTNGEISKKLGCRYQTVWRTLHRDKGLEITLQLEKKLEEEVTTE
jgi:DNA-binding CsgD family transcriptional regulator